LLLVQPAADGLDLATQQATLQSLRQELQKLRTITVAADNIADKVTDYIRALAESAQPMLRNYGDGQKLDIRWPTGPLNNPRNGDGFSTIDGNALMFFALLMPAELAEVILRAIQSNLPMPKLELEKRIAELPHEIDELSYVVASLLEAVGHPPDPLMSPPHWLGVRLAQDAPPANGHVVPMLAAPESVDEIASTSPGAWPCPASSASRTAMP
jgi:hypothetical protein